MVRISLKGGVWKNAEDEMLKAGVMKYGKNNWSRVASLLNRKTPRECKARWYEWLDPSIKKTEWTREEDETLLQLAKSMPAQWRTIAPILGRTAHQCIEHFAFLQDLALNRERTGGADGDTSAAAGGASLATRRLGPGEIDPSPETKPARPDPVDMDDEDREMLQEVRARLANTKGKKATRKAREKHLEDAHRLAQLQKLRELRAAGIDMQLKQKKKRNEIDYAKEVPFQRTAPTGPFDTSADRARESTIRADALSSFIGAEVGKLDGEKYQEREARERVKDAQRERLRKETALPELIQRLNALNDPAQTRTRAALALPAPQVRDRDLEALARGGGLSAALAETARAAASGSLVTGARGGVTDREYVLNEVRTITELHKGAEVAADTDAPAPAPVKSDFSGVIAARTKTAAHTIAPLALAAQAQAQQQTQAPAPAHVQRGKAVAPRTGPADGPAAAAEQSRKRLRALFAALPEAEAEYQLVWPELPRLDARDAGVTQLLHAASAGALAAAEARTSVAAAASGAGAGAGPGPYSAGAEAGTDADADAETAASKRAAAAAFAADRAVRALPQPLQRGFPRPARVNAATGVSAGPAIAAITAAAASNEAVAAAVASLNASAARNVDLRAYLARAQTAVAQEAVAQLKRDAAMVPMAVTMPAPVVPGTAAATAASAGGMVPLPAHDAAVGVPALRAHALAIAKAGTSLPAPALPAAELAAARALVAAEVAATTAAAAANAGADTATPLLGPVVDDFSRGLYLTAEDAAAAAAGEPLPSDAAADTYRRSLVSRADVAAAHALCGPDSIVFVPTAKRFGVLAALPPTERAAAEAQAVALLKAHEGSLRARADKLQQRLVVTQGGYAAKMHGIEKEIKTLWAGLAQARVNTLCYESMFEHEKSETVGLRVARLRLLVDAQKEMEAGFQRDYVASIRELEALVESPAPMADQ
jgi:hypothetical protein